MPSSADSHRPPRGRIPTLAVVIERCPWNVDSAQAREHARRVATHIQAREYLLWLLEMHPPNLSVAHGIGEIFWARDGVILEEIITGYARWALGRGAGTTNDFTKSMKAIEGQQPLPVALRARIDRARGGRNRATHGRTAPVVRTDYRTMSAGGLRRQLDPDLIDDVMAVLRRRMPAQ